LFPHIETIGDFGVLDGTPETNESEQRQGKVMKLDDAIRAFRQRLGAYTSVTLSGNAANLRVTRRLLLSDRGTLVEGVPYSSCEQPSKARRRSCLNNLPF
jgi:hypothetical protein